MGLSSVLPQIAKSTNKVILTSQKGNKLIRENFEESKK